MTDSFLLLRLSRPGFCPPIEEPTSVEICPVDTVPSPLELRSTLVEIYPMLFVISADDSIIKKLKTAKYANHKSVVGEILYIFSCVYTRIFVGYGYHMQCVGGCHIQWVTCAIY